MLFERLVRPALFRIGGGDAEAAHDRTLRWLAAAAQRPALLDALRGRYAEHAPRTVFGVDFPNPVGLAAGMDKDGVALPAWPALGFGFVEVGTVTWHAQPGNDRPRLFRDQSREAIINRMGFNNRGAQALAQVLDAHRRDSDAHRPRSERSVLGISIGKSAVTPLDEAVDDYVASFKALREYGDYFAVNVSSPNTLGLRKLQDRDHLDALLGALTDHGKPILVKIAPDLTDHAVGEVIEICTIRGAAGIIATNTTATNNGGLSGRPLSERARNVVEFVASHSDLPVIGVGGIVTPDDAARMFDAGASLVQLYTGFVYHGPALVKAISRKARAR